MSITIFVWLTPPVRKMLEIRSSTMLGDQKENEDNRHDTPSLTLSGKVWRFRWLM